MLRVKGTQRFSADFIKLVIYLTSLVAFVSVSILFYCNYEGWSPEVAIGFAIVTLATVGYGYHHPTDDRSRLFTIFFMLFGVYFVFAGINELIATRMEAIRKAHKREKVKASRQRFMLNVCCIFLVLFVGALIFMGLEDWTFITSLYFAIQTTTTIGFGDISMPKQHTRVFLCFYIVLSAGLVAYLFGNLHMLKAAIKVLNEDEARTKKRLSMEYMIQMDTGAGVTRPEFILAILEQQGLIDYEKDIVPWQEKFNALDIGRTGRLFKRELEVFNQQETMLANSRLEEINRERSESIVSVNDIADIAGAAERVLRSPWTSMDEGPVRVTSPQPNELHQPMLSPNSNHSTRQILSAIAEAAVLPNSANC